MKQRLNGEIDDLQLQMDAANQNAIALEKRAKNFDKVVVEWKSKVEELTNQLDETQRENRWVWILHLFEIVASTNWFNQCPLEMGSPSLFLKSN